MSSRDHSLVPGQLPLPLYVIGKSTFYTRTEIPVSRSSEQSPIYRSHLPVSDTYKLTPCQTEAWAVHQHSHLVARQSYDALSSREIKVIVAGDGCTGKSALIEQFINQDFSCEYNSTRTLVFRSKAVQYKDDIYTLNFWDRPGDDKLLDCIDNDDGEFYRDAKAALVVYDLTRLQTLPNIVLWKERIDNFVCASPDKSIPIFLLGNKCDVNCGKECLHDASAFAPLHDFQGHVRTSAKMRVGTDTVLEKLVRQVLKDYPRIPETLNQRKVDSPLSSDYAKL